MAEILSTLSVDGLAGTPTNGGARYTLMSTWEAAQQQNLVTGGNTAVLECYVGTYTDSTSITIAGWTANATNNITVRNASGNGHNGIVGSGAIIQTPVDTNILTLSGSGVSSTVIRGIELRIRYTYGNRVFVSNADFAHNCYFDGIIFSHSGSTASAEISVFSPLQGQTVVNCLGVAPSHAGTWRFIRGIRLNSLGGSGISFYSNTIVGFDFFAGFDAPDTANSPANIMNNIHAAGVNSFFQNTYTGTGWPIENNATWEATTPTYGTVWQTAISIADGVDFVSPSTGNYRPQTGGKLDNEGKNLFTTFTKDIANQTRPSSGAWSIGAYAASTGASISFTGPDVGALSGTQGTPLPDPTPNPSMASRFTATGTVTYALAPSSGPLPAGVTINPATGNLVGTPTATGAFPGIIVRGTAV